MAGDRDRLGCRYPPEELVVAGSVESDFRPEIAMDSRLLMTLEVAVAPPQKIGAAPHGARAIASITGGA